MVAGPKHARFPPHAADALHAFGTDGTLAEDAAMLVAESARNVGTI